MGLLTTSLWAPALTIGPFQSYENGLEMSNSIGDPNAEVLVLSSVHDCQ